MPTCEYCDGAVPAGAARCPSCRAPRDPSGDRPEPSPPEPSPAPVARDPSPVGASGDGRPDEPAGGRPEVQAVLQSLQQGDAGGVARGLQQMASTGQLDVGKLAADLGISGGSGGLDLSRVARSLTGGGSKASLVASALGRQGTSLGGVLGALRSPAGLAVGGAALAAAGIGAGMLLARSREGGGSAAQGVKDALGRVLPGGGGGLGALLGSGTAGPSPEDAAQLRLAAEQLPPARAEQLREGQMVLARWEGDDWRPGQVGWVDGGQARVTFESGFERWCEPADIRLAPTPGQPPPASEARLDAPHRAAPSGFGDEPEGFSVNQIVEAMWGPGDFRRGEVLEIDTSTSRLRVRYETGYEAWLEPGQVRRLG